MSSLLLSLTIGSRLGFLLTQSLVSSSLEQGEWPPQRTSVRIRMEEPSYGSQCGVRYVVGVDHLLSLDTLSKAEKWLYKPAAMISASPFSDGCREALPSPLWISHGFLPQLRRVILHVCASVAQHCLFLLWLQACQTLLSLLQNVFSLLFSPGHPLLLCKEHRSQQQPNKV